MEKKDVCPRPGLLRLVLMGVSGCGKSSIGTALSARIGIPYLEGDELHPATNRARMAAGLPLRDMDRWPWLDLIAARLARQAPLIVGCSALRRAYRDHLRVQAGGVVSFVYLRGTAALLQSRLMARQGHFFPTALPDRRKHPVAPLTFLRFPFLGEREDVEAGFICVGACGSNAPPAHSVSSSCSGLSGSPITLRKCSYPGRPPRPRLGICR